MRKETPSRPAGKNRAFASARAALLKQQPAARSPAPPATAPPASPRSAPLAPEMAGTGKPRPSPALGTPPAPWSVVASAAPRRRYNRRHAFQHHQPRRRHDVPTGEKGIFAMERAPAGRRKARNRPAGGGRDKNQVKSQGDKNNQRIKQSSPRPKPVRAMLAITASKRYPDDRCRRDQTCQQRDGHADLGLPFIRGQAG